MKPTKHIIIAGAGGIAEAAGLLLMAWSDTPIVVYIGNHHKEKAIKVAQWIQEGLDKEVKIIPFHLDLSAMNEEMRPIFDRAEAILDCLPGGLAPSVAQYAKTFNLHYANLTEYVAETNQIVALAKNAKTGFVLQTGLAPGYINVLANYLFQSFCSQYEVQRADHIACKVGALTNHAQAPHYYGFTWSPIGVATEYLKDAIAIRDYKKVILPALSERQKIRISGIDYEEDLTSGGAADLPDAFAGVVKSLDYKTLRHPGHYAWIEAQLKDQYPLKNAVKHLEDTMLKAIPHVEEDQIILYASVQGKDQHGVLRKKEIAKKITPMKVGKHTLRAIQVTTAAPLIESILWLLASHPKGIILQSEIPPIPFLHGQFVKKVYGSVHHP
ncbi:saccharopine dehydrogenase NADP-binding domain-containing protein [Flavobacteriaceae bacterium F08102]|nr:saccharopine dehydrogenase NADP-binding domain-containing protein [Flavobacteriaceae bacterium F08102]